MFRFAGKVIDESGATHRCEGNYDNVWRKGKGYIEGVIFSNDDKTFKIGGADLYLEGTQYMKVTLYDVTQDIGGRYCYKFTTAG